MPNRFFATAATATLLYLTTATVALAQTSGQAQSSMNAEQGWSSIARCAQEETERGRHACVDKVLRGAGLLTDEMSAQQQRRAFGLDERSAPAARTPPAAFVATAPTASSTPAASAATASANRAPDASAANTAPSAAPPDRLEVSLTKVEKAANGRLFVTTSDGAVWLQTESVSMPLPPVAGDRMSIRKGSLGGYVCSVASTRLTYRCIRNR